MTDPKYAAFKALDPFFNIVQQGLAGLVDGDHYFDTIADDAVFEFRYIFPGWPQRLDTREALVTLYMGYGDNIVLHSADSLITNRSQDPRVVIIEYEVHGKMVRTGASYDNRFISVVTIEDRKIRAMAGLYGLPGRDDCTQRLRLKPRTAIVDDEQPGALDRTEEPRQTPSSNRSGLPRIGGAENLRARPRALGREADRV